MKKILLLLIMVLLSALTTGCMFHSHEWQEATCEEPKTCSQCGETAGVAEGHNWQEATCVKPETCDKCGATNGEARGHDWKEATCTEAKECKVCKEIGGQRLGHQWEDATYETPKTCKRCNLTEGEKLRLSDECDEVLQRINYNGNEYEIVMNKWEDYGGVHVEIGVIKNDTWVIQPTSEMPFVKNKVYSSNPNSEGTITYIGKGCFVSKKEYKDSRPLSPSNYRYIFYNVENGKSYVTEVSTKGDLPLDGNQDDDYCVVARTSDYTKINQFVLLNKSTMETKTVALTEAPDYWDQGTFGPVSEGVFWVCCHMPMASYNTAFYDTNGKKVIDLSEYCVVSGQFPRFVNGECTIKIKNDNDNYYNITINKSGEVIRSVETSKY